jgi:hypothetical protein
MSHQHATVALVLIACAALGGCSGGGDESSTNRVNGSVHVPAGKAPDVAKTVNGGIDIDPNATVTTAETVNGGIRLGAHATAESVTTVNGGVTLDDGAKVSGKVESVNGSFTLHDGADVGGPLENVNGSIQLRAAHVGGGIKTVDGNIDIEGASHVDNGLWVQKPDNGFFHFVTQVPRIIIGPGATVDGSLRFDREVQLYVSDRATVGTVTGATAIKFSGDTPNR